MKMLFVVPYYLVLLLILVSGCRMPWPAPGVEVDSHPSKEVRVQYDKALETYHEGDYGTAALQFKALREQSSGGNLARMALYGQACAQLMGAQNPLDYQTALNLWQTWLSSAPMDVDHESPVTMAPLVKEKMLFSNLPPVQLDAASLKEEKELIQWVLIKTRQELDHLKKELAVSEKAVQQREKRIGAMKKEIAKLKAQILALETIDQKIQEKKNAIPSAD